MVVKEHSIRQLIVLLVILGELERERTIGGSLLVPFGALVSWLSLLTSVAVENIDAVAIWIVPLGALRYQLYVQRGKNIVHFVPYSCHILEIFPLKDVYIHENAHLAMIATTVVVTLS
jgi:hypothetical protein